MSRKVAHQFTDLNARIKRLWSSQKSNFHGSFNKPVLVGPNDEVDGKHDWYMVRYYSVSLRDKTGKELEWDLVHAKNETEAFKELVNELRKNGHSDIVSRIDGSKSKVKFDHETKMPMAY